MIYPFRSLSAGLAFASILSLVLSCDDTPDETVDTTSQAATCRAVELSISRSPGSAWTTDEETLSLALSFVLPDRLTVVANNAGLHDVTFSYRLGEALHTCLYRARWKAVGQQDQFVSCTSGAVPGEAIEADWVAPSGSRSASGSASTSASVSVSASASAAASVSASASVRRSSSVSA